VKNLLLLFDSKYISRIYMYIKIFCATFFLLPCRDSHFKNKISNRLSVCEVWLQSFCYFTAAYPRYPREAKVTLTITGAPRKGNDSGEGARRGEQGAGRGWPPTATYKFQEWSPPGVKRSSTPAETDSTCVSRRSDPII